MNAYLGEYTHLDEANGIPHLSVSNYRGIVIRRQGA